LKTGGYNQLSNKSNIRFVRYAGKEEGISDSELKEAVNRLEAGQAAANVYKVRVARSGEGKSGAYRVIVLFRSGERVFYVYGFAKSERSNISEKELRNFKEIAKEYFSIELFRNFSF
jgi:hypothetical protein